jgi:hypothetical protein
MRARGEHGRDEGDRRSRTGSRDRLTPIMDGPRHESAPASTMRAVLPTQRSATRANEDQSTAARDRAKTLEHPRALRRGRGVMAEDDTRAARQPIDRLP